MYFPRSMTAVVITVLLAIGKVAAVPLPQTGAPGLIPLRLTPPSPFNGNNYNTTGPGQPTNRTVIPTAPYGNSTTNHTLITTPLYSNTTSKFPIIPTNHTVIPSSPYSNSTGNITYGAHYANRTTTGTFAANGNVSYPWMANRTASGPYGTPQDSTPTNKPIKPSATVTYKPFEGSAVALGKASGAWILVVAVIGAMAML